MNLRALFFSKRSPLVRTIAITCLAVFFIAPLAVSGNPDSILPLLPECLALIGLCFFVSLSKYEDHSGNLKFSSAERTLVGGLGVVVFVYLCSRMIISLSNTPHQVWNPCEHIAPSVFVRLECYLHGAIIQFPGPRQFYMTLTAFSVGVLAFVAARTSAITSKLLLSSMAFFSVCYCLCVQLGMLFGKDTFLPEFLGKSEFGKQRFALIITNPGWIWPYLAPGLVALFWLSLKCSSKINRTLSMLGASTVVYAIFQTGQRGGLLLVITLVSIILGFSLFTLSKRISKGHKIAVISAASIIGFLSFLGQDAYVILNE